MKRTNRSAYRSGLTAEIWLRSYWGQRRGGEGVGACQSAAGGRATGYVVCTLNPLKKVSAILRVLYCCRISMMPVHSAGDGGEMVNACSSALGRASLQRRRSPTKYISSAGRPSGSTDAMPPLSCVKAG